MTSIFLSYRRDDVPGHAGRLYDRLVARFSAANVFRDLETIDPGLDFHEVIERGLRTCGVFLALIGPSWLSSADKKGRPRLAQENDWVRLEVATALSRNIRVIPVLVEDAVMPGVDELPDALHKLARRSAIEISDDRWDYDCGRLIQTIERVLPDTQVVGTAAKEAPKAEDARLARGPSTSPRAIQLGPQPFQAAELIGGWHVEVRALITSRMVISFDASGTCDGYQELFGANVPFAGTWFFAAANQAIQVNSVVYLQPLQFGMRITGRTPNGFIAVDDNQVTYVFHRRTLE